MSKPLKVTFMSLLLIINKTESYFLPMVLPFTSAAQQFNVLQSECHFGRNCFPGGRVNLEWNKARYFPLPNAKIEFNVISKQYNLVITNQEEFYSFVGLFICIIKSLGRDCLSVCIGKVQSTKATDFTEEKCCWMTNTFYAITLMGICGPLQSCVRAWNREFFPLLYWVLRSYTFPTTPTSFLIFHIVLLWHNQLFIITRACQFCPHSAHILDRYLGCLSLHPIPAMTINLFLKGATRRVDWHSLSLLS